MTEPTDAEIIAVMRDGYNCRYNDEADHIDFARAVLAKWGTLQTEKIVIPTDTMEQEFQKHYQRGFAAGKKANQPAHSGEPVGEVVWAAGVPNSIREVHLKRWNLPIGTKLYTTPQPTQPQAGAVPLTDEQIEALPLWKRFVGLWPETRREIVRTIESAHGIGIKGGQHGTE